MDLSSLTRVHSLSLFLSSPPRPPPHPPPSPLPLSHPSLQKTRTNGFPTQANTPRERSHRAPPLNHRRSGHDLPLDRRLRSQRARRAPRASDRVRVEIDVRVKVGVRVSVTIRATVAIRVRVGSGSGGAPAGIVPGPVLCDNRRSTARLPDGDHVVEGAGRHRQRRRWWASWSRGRGPKEVSQVRGHGVLPAQPREGLATQVAGEIRNKRSLLLIPITATKMLPATYIYILTITGCSNWFW